LKLFLASKAKTLDQVFAPKKMGGESKSATKSPVSRIRTIRRKNLVKLKKVGRDARTALQAKRLWDKGGMTWDQIAETLGYKNSKNLPSLIEEYADTIEAETQRLRSAGSSNF
jgi:hypothetical protein